MKNILYKVFAIGLTLLFSQQIIAQQSPLRMWYDSSATFWEACLPLGNGRLGAMSDGGVFTENIVLNDITLWSGSPEEADKPGAYKYLPEIQQLLIEGKNIEAEQVMDKYFVCDGKGSGHGRGANIPYGSYQVLGTMNLKYDYGSDSANIKVNEYVRELSLDNAISKTQFSIGNTTYMREYFTSFDNDVIVIRLSSNQSRKINFSLSLSRPENYSIVVKGNQLQMIGQLNNGIDGKGMKYISRVEIKPEGGIFQADEKSLKLNNADAATIYISIKTDYKDDMYLASSEKILKNALKQKYTNEKTKHIQKYQSLFKRATLDIGGTKYDNLPTDKRLEIYASNPEDNGLINLYFQYGRYLLIGSTRENLLPPNLQGLWCNTIDTPWNGDYHLDINIQMNHWPLEITNLGMLNGPFFDLVKSLVSPGEKTAKAYYNGKGWVSHVITNIWGFTSPGEYYGWGACNTGSAWLCQMLWTHYEYTKDVTYLKKLYPILKGSSEFYLSTMIKEPKCGWLVTAPSNSPENVFVLPNGKNAHVCMGPTMDNQLIRYLFSKTIESCNELDFDQSFRQELEEAIKLIPPNQIGKDGRLMEWLEEYKEAEPHHRHVSHLWDLYPGDGITASQTELVDASRASLEMRGDNGTGWSSAWKMNFWARLHDGNRALKLLRKLLNPSRTKVMMSTGGGTYPSFLCAGPPFQIDGNFGGTAGIAEMLIQSHEGYIELLPALPDQWRDGSFSGLCVRGGGEVSLKWNNAKPENLIIKSIADNEFKIKVPIGVTKVDVKNVNKEEESITPVNGFISVKLSKGKLLEISFI